MEPKDHNMIRCIVMALVLMSGAAHAQGQCRGGGVPGLAVVAAKLKVKASPASPSALNDCIGNAYEIGALLGAAVDRIEKAEKNAADAKAAVDAIKREQK